MKKDGLLTTVVPAGFMSARYRAESFQRRQP